MIARIPPISVPVASREILSSVLAPRDSGRRFPDALRRATGLSTVDLFGSGRAALSSLLAGLATGDRDEVAVPAYTCWSVPASVVRSGLRVRVLDVDPATLGFDGAAVETVSTARLAAIVGAHLFARSCDVAGLVREIRRRDGAVRVVEDSAQAWPLEAPSPADAVILSFGRGKPVALGGGGAVAHSGRPLAASDGAGREGGWLDAASLVATKILAKPLLYRLPSSLPFLGIGETVYEPGFDASPRMWSWQERLGSRVVDALPALRARRRDNARRIAEHVRRARGFSLPALPHDDGPLRLPVLAPSRATRERMLRELAARGVSASAMYPGTLLDVAALRPRVVNPDAPIPGARELADRLLTLPVYPTLAESEVERIARAFEEAARACA
jgi:dTDP-4-amino-4,6-dideoxygalactose transaminase